jgi:hypothetical protein
MDWQQRSYSKDGKPGEQRFHSPPSTKDDDDDGGGGDDGDILIT